MTRKRGRPKGSGVTPPSERFMSKVAKTNTCWLWTGCTHPSGYGKFFTHKNAEGKAQIVYAHRWSYEFFVGPIPVNLELDHLCRTKGCVNPDHLEPVTRGENQRRIPISARPKQMQPWTHCKRGHELTPQNVYISSHGRACKVCARIRRGLS